MVTLTDSEFNLLISLLPEWSVNSRFGMDPTFYGTGSYETDQVVCEAIKIIIGKNPTHSRLAKERE